MFLSRGEERGLIVKDPYHNNLLEPPALIKISTHKNELLPSESENILNPYFEVQKRNKHIMYMHFKFNGMVKLDVNALKKSNLF